MFRTILVPLDGTAFGEQALPLAMHLAARAQAELHLVHVHAPTLIPVGLEAPPYAGAARSDLARESVRFYLERMAAKLGQTGLAVSSALRDGPVVATIEERVRAVGAELVVLSTHGRGGLSLVWHQGVADQLRRQLAVPLLLVPAAAEELPDGPRERPIQHVLVPLDGSAFAETVLEYVGRLCRITDAACTLLHVLPNAAAPSTVWSGAEPVDELALERRRQQAEQYLHRLAERLPLAAERVRTRIAVASEPAEAILEAAERDGPELPRADLLALECHVHGRLARLFGSHVAETVLQHSPVPVLVHHPSPARGPEPVARALAVDA